MKRSGNRLLAATLLAGVALASTAVPAVAAKPSVETFSVHREFPFADCPGFATIGAWDIDHRITYYYDSDGVAIRDHDQVDFRGRIINAETGAWVADSGSRTFFDTLAPDGSFLTTYMVTVRKSTYVHEAGRVDFQTGAFHGHEGFGPGNITALCEALGG